MNKSDSERIAGALNQLGFRPAPGAETADLIVFNLCSVRQSAIDRATARVQNEKRKMKNKKSKTKILLTGCILGKDKGRFRKTCDGIFKIDDLPELPSILKVAGFKIADREKARDRHYLDIEPNYESSPVAFVPIMTGCNNFCSYCVVPYTRGREISRPAEDILREIKNLVRKGVKEIWLLGQNVNSYGIERKTQNAKHKTTAQKSKLINFAKLLKIVNDIEGDFWIRFTSSHPKDLTDEMIERFAKCKKITPYLNLPIQSGDNKILKAMNRPYSVADYKKLVKKARSAFKKCRQGLESWLALSTDAIVGFPGETKKQFKNTKKTFREIAFSAGYISRYSPRPQSSAFNLKDNIPPPEKRRREKELVKIIEESALNFNKQFIGKSVDALVLQKRNGFHFGKTRHHQTIKFPSGKNLTGKFIKIKVKKATAYGLEGKKY